MERECKKKTKMLPGAMIYKSMYCIINFFLKKKDQALNNTLKFNMQP